MPDAADEIFLVSTSIIDKWGISCLRRAEKTYDQEIDPATLIGPTKR